MFSIRVSLFAIAFLFLLTGVVFAEPPTRMLGNGGTPNKPVHWSFVDANVVDVLLILNEEIGWSLRPSVHGRREETVSIELDGVPAREALFRVLKACDLKFDINWQLPEDYYMVDIVAGNGELPDFSPIVARLKLAGSVPGLEVQIDLTSDGKRARWRVLPLNLAYSWCGNSYDNFTEGVLEQATFERLQERAGCLVWASDVNPGKVVWPQGIYTLQTKDGWYRGDADSAVGFDEFLNEVYAAIPSRSLLFLKEGADLRAFVEGKARPGLGRNFDIYEAFAKPFQANASVTIEKEERTLSDLLRVLTEQAGGHFFLAPQSRAHRITYSCQVKSADDVLTELEQKTGLEVRRVDDLVLMGSREDLDSYPEAMQLWRDQEFDPRTRWVHLDLPADLDETKLQILQNHKAEEAVVRPDPNGGWRVIGKGWDLASVLGWGREWSRPAEPPKEEDLGEQSSEDIWLGNLSMRQAKEIILRDFPEVTIGPAEHGGDFAVVGTLQSCREAEEACRRTSEIENLPEMDAIAGFAFVTGLEPIDELMSEAGYPGSYYLFQRDYGSDPILVRGQRGRLNHSKVLSGRVQPADAPQVRKFVKEKFYRGLASKDGPIHFVQEE